ncbi:McrC family protein [Neorhizobium alkalisoli]|uniref:McrC family protein n=1 Tax=Neorhizobium alkalisoli TaxID=528178 RepID=UPI001FE22600|nr:McrC family protein [Neorhizobium alkalisoli]
MTTKEVPASLDRISIPPSAFDWLFEHGRGDDDTLPLVQIESPDTISVQNYVGVIETPCGTQIEILPKHTSDENDAGVARRLLITMITESMKITPRRAPNAEIAAFNLPMTEWLASAFLDEASELVRRGLRSGYTTFETREPFLRGKLDVARQISATGGLHRFSIRFNEFSLNRPENRILRSAVEHVARRTKSDQNWRRARELSILLGDVPVSNDIPSDLGSWEQSRQLADYIQIRPLCDLLLSNRLPFAVAGNHRGASMLFPMERLFERYVFSSLKSQVPAGVQVLWQSHDKYLCALDAEGWFRMKPDIVVIDGTRTWVFDAKWKRLTSSRKGYFGLDQSDFYQLFAYGQKYMAGAGDMFLIYPAVPNFPVFAEPFELTKDLRLHVLPFDLYTRDAPMWHSVICQPHCNE